MWLSGVRQKQTDLLHVGLNAPNEERVGYTQSGHESVEGVLGRRRKKIKKYFCISFVRQ